MPLLDHTNEHNLGSLVLGTDGRILVTFISTNKPTLFSCSELH
jgi:hypothetical protein